MHGPSHFDADAHHPHNYTAEMAMRQAALYMLHHPYKYFKCVKQDLLRSGESYESYCYNVFNKNVWGDDFIAAVFGDMWNVAISIVTPISRKPMELSGDRGYVRTEEREMSDIAADKKRKVEEQLKEQELKKQKVIAVGEGSEDVEIVQGAQAEVEETYHQKLARQQQEIIKQYETLLQQ